MQNNYIHVDNEIKSMKQLLNVEMEKYTIFNQVITTAKEYIPIAQITKTKLHRFTSYIDLLNKDEKLREQFNVMLTNYETSRTLRI